MKRTFRILLAFYGVVIILTASCRKSDNDAVSTVTTTTNSNGTYNYTLVNQLFSTLHPVVQTLQVSAGSYQNLHAANGTLLKFYPNSFKDNNGKIITSGIINIKIAEMYSPGLMIASRSSGFSSGKLLQSAGQVYIKATDANGTEVFANKYGIGFKEATQGNKSYSLFYGTPDPQDSVISWSSAAGGKGTTVVGTMIDSFDIVSIDSNATGVDTMVVRTNYNRFDSCTSFNWISCSSFFAANGEVTNIVVTPSDTAFNPGNTSVYLYFPDLKSITDVNNYYYIPHSFSLMNGYQVPVGVKVDLIAIAYISGNYYLYEQTNINITNGMSFTPTLVPATLTQIQTVLAAL